MLVSVIVPTRDRPALLHTALAVIGQQSHAEVEVVVVDDGSLPDNGRANEALVAALGRASSYRYIDSREQGGSGPSVARNAGLKAARGELIAFCDDDDEWCDVEHLAAAVAVFRESVDVDLVFGNQDTSIGGQRGGQPWLPLLAQRLRLDARQDGERIRLARAECLIDHFPHLNTCVFRRALLDRAGGFWEGVRYSEDMDLYVRAIERARGVVYRHHTVSIHHVPDPTQATSASTRLSPIEKELTMAAVANHLLETCPSAAAQRYARRVAGFAYRRLALAEARANNPKGALAFARLGLAIWPGARWFAYTGWLAARAWSRP
jgi:hypothetical protein